MIVLKLDFGPRNTIRIYTGYLYKGGFKIVYDIRGCHRTTRLELALVDVVYIDGRILKIFNCDGFSMMMQVRDYIRIGKVL